MLDAAYITENDINWVLKLRDSKKINLEKLKYLKRLNVAPYAVYNKFTKSIIEK